MNLRIRFYHHRKDEPFAPTSRFGGGWDWAIGIKTCCNLHCWLIELLFFYIRIDILSGR